MDGSTRDGRVLILEQRGGEPILNAKIRSQDRDFISYYCLTHIIPFIEKYSIIFDSMLHWP